MVTLVGMRRRVYACCSIAEHDALKESGARVAAETYHIGWLQDDEGPVELRNCRRCESTLAITPAQAALHAAQEGLHAA